MNVDLDALRADLKLAEARANDLREFIRLAERLYGSVAEAPRRPDLAALAGGSSRSDSAEIFPGVQRDSAMVEPVDAKQATKRLLRETSPKEWTADEVAAEITRRGWVRHLSHPKPAVGVALSRLHRDEPQIQRPRMGYYRWVPFPAPLNTGD